MKAVHHHLESPPSSPIKKGKFCCKKQITTSFATASRPRMHRQVCNISQQRQTSSNAEGRTNRISASIHASSLPPSPISHSIVIDRRTNWTTKHSMSGRCIIMALQRNYCVTENAQRGTTRNRATQIDRRYEEEHRLKHRYQQSCCMVGLDVSNIRAAIDL